MRNTMVDWRMERGLTQTQLAQAMMELARKYSLDVQVGQKDISRWETGQIEPSISRVLLMAEVLGTSADDLFFIK